MVPKTATRWQTGHESCALGAAAIRQSLVSQGGKMGKIKKKRGRVKERTWYFPPNKGNRGHVVVLGFPQMREQFYL